MLYQIYDGENNSLMSDYPEIEAQTGKGAIMKYLESTGRGNYKLKRSAGNDVKFCAEGFYRKDGNKYRLGNKIWYEIINNK